MDSHPLTANTRVASPDVLRSGRIPLPRGAISRHLAERPRDRLRGASLYVGTTLAHASRLCKSTNDAPFYRGGAGSRKAARRSPTRTSTQIRIRKTRSRRSPAPSASAAGCLPGRCGGRARGGRTHPKPSTSTNSEAHSVTVLARVGHRSPHSPELANPEDAGSLAASTTGPPLWSAYRCRSQRTRVRETPSSLPI